MQPYSFSTHALLKKTYREAGNTWILNPKKHPPSDEFLPESKRDDVNENNFQNRRLLVGYIISKRRRMRRTDSRYRERVKQILKKIILIHFFIYRRVSRSRTLCVRYGGGKKGRILLAVRAKRWPSGSSFNFKLRN